MSKIFKVLVCLSLSFIIRQNINNKCCGANSLFAQTREMVIPMVKTPFPVHGATWNKDGSCFAYTEENSIIVRDAFEYSLIHTIPTWNGNLKYMQFTQSTEGDADQLATLSEENVMEIRLWPETEPLNSVLIDEENFPTALAYNWNGNYLATADTGKYVYIYMQNYLTETLIERRSEVLNSIATSLSFSPDNKFLAVGSEDDQIYILEVSSGKVLYSINYPNALNVTPLFTKDSEHIIYPTKNKQIIISDLYGNEVRKIKTKALIKNIALSSDGSKLIVCCDNNQFYYYDLETGKLLGYIPRYTHANLTCFAFNNTDNLLLEGFDDGCIFILDVDDVFLLPNEKPPRFKLYVADDATSDKGKKLNPDDLSGKRKGGLYTKQGHEIVLDTSFAVVPSPYTMAVSFGAGYKNYDLIRPFYFGGEIEPFMGFPKEDFPYKYKLRGGSIKSPKLMGIKIYAPVGFAMLPFNNDIEVFGEVLTGTSICWLWNGLFGSDSISSKMFPSLYIAAKVGAGWKWFSLSIRGEYDTILKFSLSADLAYRITLPKTFK